MPTTRHHRYATIGFRLYVYKGGGLNHSSGTVALLNNHGTQIAQRPFNNWDEIPAIMRRLIRRKLKLTRKWHRDHWEYG